MAIGSLKREGRLAQLRTFAAVQVRAGYRADDDVRAEVYDALVHEVGDPTEAARLTDAYLADARADWLADASGWPAETDVDRLFAVFADLEAADIVVLQAVDDHWAAHDLLAERAAHGQTPRGLAYFTPTDVWHAIEHGMLEVNLWHGSEANVADSDQLLTEVINSFLRRGLPAHFDEGRIEVTVAWQRRPTT